MRVPSLTVPAGEDMTELDRRLAEVEALRRRVLNVIPHALRTPITTFRGLAEALVHATEPEIRTQITPAMRRLAAQAEHLLDDMLIAAGYTTALPTGEPTATPVVETVRAVWSELAPDQELAISGDASVRAMAPAGALFKMLVHLLDNAAKYGDEPRSVVVGQADGRVTIEIETAGSELADLSMLGEPFYRGEKAVMRASGLGVGLTVAIALAVQAGGSLTVHGGTNGGLVARVELAAP